MLDTSEAPAYSTFVCCGLETFPVSQTTVFGVPSGFRLETTILKAVCSCARDACESAQLKRGMLCKERTSPGLLSIEEGCRGYTHLVDCQWGRKVLDAHCGGMNELLYRFP